MIINFLFSSPSSSSSGSSSGRPKVQKSRRGDGYWRRPKRREERRQQQEHVVLPSTASTAAWWITFFLSRQYHRNSRTRGSCCCFFVFFSLVCLFRLTSPRLTLGFIYKCLLVFSFAVEIMPEETKLDVILKSSRPFVLRGCKVPTFTQFSPLSSYNLSLVAHTRDDWCCFCFFFSYLFLLPIYLSKLRNKNQLFKGFIIICFVFWHVWAALPSN